jgi:NitT/TauT family transport system permease protein
MLMAEAETWRPASSGGSAFAARLWKFIAGSTAARRFLILVLFALVWQGVAAYGDNPILFPTFIETASAFWDAVWQDRLLAAAGASLLVLLKGYVFAVALALVMVSAAVANGFAREVLQTLATMFSPLPAIALLPIAMLWFGLGEKSLLLVLVYSVIWPFALAALTGFESVPETQRLVGRNYGLRGLRYVMHILIPGALAPILAGLQVGWAFAWRTLIAAELVFGVTSSEGGLGWFIYRARNELYTDKAFAGLAAVIVIGLTMEAVVFRTIERATVRRWGMQR